SLSYDPLADLLPVSLISRFPLFMFVPNSSPAKSVMEFIAYAKAHPGKITLASPGTGSAPHLAGELFRQMAKIDLAHVPYRGAAPQRSHSRSGSLLFRQRDAARKHALGPDPWARSHRRQKRSGSAGIAHHSRGRHSGI